MTKKPMGSAATPSAEASVPRGTESPIGAEAAARPWHGPPPEDGPTLGEALDQYIEDEDYDDDYALEFGGVSVGLMIASIVVGTVAALFAAGLVVAAAMAVG